MSAQDPDQILCCPHGCEAERGNTCGAATVGPEILSALAAAGLVIVPQEPTDEMCEAARARHDADDRDADKYALYRSIGRAMIAAALPAAPTQEASDDGR